MHAEVAPHVPSLIGGGEIGRLVRSTDWSGTPLGAYASWPQSLRSALSLVLNSKGIAALYWGTEQWLLYNDAYGDALGDRHPAAFGRPMPEVLTDIAPVLGPQVTEVLRTGQGFAVENVPLTMERAGRDPATWWTYSFSPVQGEGDGFAGVLLLATETTEQRMRERSERRERTRLEMALRVARLGAYDWDIATGTVVLDPRGREMFGLPADGHVSDAEVFDRIAAEDVARVRADAERALASADDGLRLGENIDVDYDIILPDGTRRSIANSGAVMVDEAGSQHMVGAFNDVTSLKQAQTQLVDQNATLEERVAALAAERDRFWRLSRDPFLICDLEGRWVNASPVWTEILGWRLDELIGRTSSWIEHPDDVDRTRRKVADAGAGEVVLDFTNRFRGKDGSYRSFSWTAIAEGDRLFCVARNVTDEIARAETLRLYESIIRSDSAPVCAFDTECRLIAFNQAHSDEFFRIFGTRVQVGDVFPDRFPPDQGAIMRGFMERALAGEVFSVTEEFGDPDLEVPYWEVSYNPLRTADGTIVGAFHHAVDVTARLRAQDDLRKTTTRANTFFSFSNDYLFLIEVDAAGVSRIADMNPACEQAMGLVRSEVIGRTVDEVLPPDSAGDISHYGRLCLKTRDAQTYLATRRYTEGRDLVIEGRVTFVEGEAGGGGLLLFSGSDVTERRQVEDQLRQAQKMEAVGQLTGGLAHDFNNLLTGMMGNLELLQLKIAGGRFDDVDRFVTAAQGAARRAASLTQRLLAFSRRQTLDPRPTDVNRLIVGMEELLRRSVGGTAEIEVVGAAGLWSANIDAAQLENALLNLCINARDAMPGGGRIAIETANTSIDERTARERDLSPGQYLSICVTDTGSGMSAATIERAFEPFFTTKPIGQGTGLGLSMIYGFARQSGGQVRIDSEVDHGTTVCICLPRHQGEEASADAVETHFQVGEANGQTILVVDDEATIRHLLDEVLDEAGYTVINVADGAAGIKVLQSGARIELLITDVGLPGGMNGRQVADAARVLRPGLKVLFITGYAENAAVGNGHLEPGMELLTKPFSMEAVTAKIGAMMAKGSGSKCQA